MTKKDLRPLIASAIITDNMSLEEKFQNGVLRPVLKLQHQSIIALFQHVLAKNNVLLKKMEIFKKNEYIQTAVSKNQSLKNQYIGLIVGMLTDDELLLYLKNTPEYNKRIIAMVVQRIQDTL